MEKQIFRRMLEMICWANVMLGGVANRERKYLSSLPELRWQTYDEEKRKKEKMIL